MQHETDHLNGLERLIAYGNRQSDRSVQVLCFQSLSTVYRTYTSCCLSDVKDFHSANLNVAYFRNNSIARLHSFLSSPQYFINSCIIGLKRCSHA